jgi:hypothetical protein
MNRNRWIGPSFRLLTAACSALVMTLVLAPDSLAQCGRLPKPLATHASWQSTFAQPRLVNAAYLLNADLDENSRTDSIVGFWHVKFVANGTEIDAGYSQWHSDGTEIMNSGGRAPNTNDFCLGVWKKIGERKYKLNHFAAAWDPSSNTLLGPAQIKEEVTVKPDGNTFYGKFSITQRDEKGDILGSVAGDIVGIRIDADTPSENIF